MVHFGFAGLGLSSVRAYDTGFLLGFRGGGGGGGVKSIVEISFSLLIFLLFWTKMSLLGEISGEMPLAPPPTVEESYEYIPLG